MAAKILLMKQLQDLVLKQALTGPTMAFTGRAAAACMCPCAACPRRLHSPVPSPPPCPLAPALHLTTSLILPLRYRLSSLFCTSLCSLGPWPKRLWRVATPTR